MPIPLRQGVMGRTPRKNFTDTTATRDVGVRANATLSLVHAQSPGNDESRQTDREDCSEILLRDYPHSLMRASDGSRTTARETQSRCYKGVALETAAASHDRSPVSEGAYATAHRRRLCGTSLASVRAVANILGSSVYPISGQRTRNVMIRNSKWIR